MRQGILEQILVFKKIKSRCSLLLIREMEPEKTLITAVFIILKRDGKIKVRERLRINSFQQGLGWIMI